MLCQLDFKNSRKLDQAKVRLATKKERMESETMAQIEEGNSFPEPECSRQLTRSQIPTIHDQHLCVWCMKPDIVGAELLLLLLFQILLAFQNLHFQH